jgi:hypothetical protein
MALKTTRKFSSYFRSNSSSFRDRSLCNPANSRSLTNARTTKMPNLDGTRRIQDGRSHDCAMLGKGAGPITAAAATIV